MLALGILVAVGNSLVGGLLWWATAFYAGIPLALVAAVCHWLAMRSGEAERVVIVWVVLLAALAWMTYVTLAASLIVLAALVAAAPARPWRLWLFLAWGGSTLVAAGVHPMFDWSIDAQQLRQTWPPLAHILVVLSIVIALAGRRNQRVRDESVGNE